MLVPDLRLLPLMHKTGNVIVHDNSYIIDECQFDTGASDNFISKSFVDKNVDILAEFISSHKSSVRLGDSKTTVQITQLITLNVMFIDTNFVSHNPLLNFLIMPMTHIDMIMGINSILYSLYDFFLDMLRNAKNDIKKHKIPTPSPILCDMHPSICTS
jgi:hypothetical protein